MSYIRLGRRLFWFVGLTCWTVARIWWLRSVHGADLSRAMQVRRWWARNLLWRAGVRMRARGVAPNRPCLVVSNHRSYLDPILILRELDVVPVAKAELASWPVIGPGARMAGILYLRREESGSRAAVLRAMAEVIQDGHPILLFPEGTTSGVPGTLPFKRGAFQMAARLNIPIVPVAIRFADSADHWVGKESFMSHAMRSFVRPEIHVEIVFGEAMQSEDADALAAAARSWIESELQA